MPCYPEDVGSPNETPKDVALKWKAQARGEQRNWFSAFCVANQVGGANGYNDDTTIPRARNAIQLLMKWGDVKRVQRGWYRFTIQGNCKGD